MWRFCVALNLILIGIEGALQGQTAEQTAQSRKAKELMAAGQFAEAAGIYRSLLRAVPNNPGLLLNLGSAEQLSGDDRGAIPHFEQLLKLIPSSTPGRMMLSVSYLRTGQPKKAVPLLEKAVSVQPDDVEARQMLADALLMTDQYSAASVQLRKLSEKSPKNVRTWYALGRAYEALAQQTFEQLRKLAPDSAYWLLLAGESRLKAQKYNTAFVLYKEAAVKNGKLLGVHSGLAEIYRATNHAEWAASEAAKELKPECGAVTPACEFQNGRYLTLTGPSLRPSPELLFWKTRAYNQLALEAYRELSHLPESLELHEVMAEMHRNAGRYADSIAEWQQALRLSPGAASLARELSTTVYLSKDWAAAEANLREELKKDPQSPEVNFMLGDSLLNQQKSDEALPYLQKAVELQPQYLPAHATLARAYAQLGQQARAVPHLEKSLQLDTDGALHFQLARAYQAAGRKAEATDLLRRYQELSKAAQDRSEPEITAP